MSKLTTNGFWGECVTSWEVLPRNSNPLAAAQQVLFIGAHHLFPCRRITRKNVIHNDTPATTVDLLSVTQGIWLIVHDRATWCLPTRFRVPHSNLKSSVPRFRMGSHWLVSWSPTCMCLPGSKEVKKLFQLVLPVCQTSPTTNPPVSS